MALYVRWRNVKAIDVSNSIISFGVFFNKLIKLFNTFEDDSRNSQKYNINSNQKIILMILSNGRPPKNPILYSIAFFWMLKLFVFICVRIFVLICVAFKFL